MSAACTLTEPAPEVTLALAIPPRAQAVDAPPAGWCGETAIQEALLHLGAWVPQRLINQAGRPEHPDLYASEIPVALSGLGVRFVFYSGTRGFEPFARWVTEALGEGDPVLAGVKIFPTEHPAWGLDHFVLVVGHGPKGLLVNTTWGNREWVGDTTTPGLSLKDAFYGVRLSGVHLPASARPARLDVLEEGRSAVRLRVTCAAPGARTAYRIERRTGPTDERPVWVEDVVASSGRIDKELVIEADRPSRFTCVPRG